MSKEHVKGAADKVVGRSKEGAGHVTGDKRLETQGTLDGPTAAIHDKAGHINDAGKQAVDAVKNAPSRK